MACVRGDTVSYFACERVRAGGRRRIVMEMEDIVRLSLKECISIYDEMVTEIRETDGYSKIYGSAPKILLIKYGAGCMKKFDFVLTDIWNAWCYSDGKLEVAEKMREPVRKPVSGMFFAEASAEFMIDTEKQHVYLSYYFGPRYARGIRYTYIWAEPEGTAAFCKEELLWVS